MRKSMVVVVPAFLAVSGCLTVSTKLDAKGAGSMTISYVMPSGSTLEKEKAKASSADVTVEKADLKAPRVSMDLKFDDVRKLNTAKLFEDVRVSLDTKDGQQVLVATIERKRALKLPETTLEKIGRQVKITLDLPGDVVETNGKKAGPMEVAWEFPTNDFVGVAQNVLKVTYKQAPAEGSK
jgi:hypothetical protein